MLSNHMMMNVRKTIAVLGTPIDVIDWRHAIELIATWSSSRSSKIVCICNAHSVVTARIDKNFQKILCSADLATADGAPIAWLLRHAGEKEQVRINGPDLMWKYLQRASSTGEAMYFYGSLPGTLKLLQERLLAEFPGIVIAGAYSPPFRPLTKDEDAAVVDAINASGANVVWVSLGCPKQEKWMFDHREEIQAVMIGVGAAFDYHAGTVRRAPVWMQQSGLEWLYRVWAEPRRLWKRYLVTNSIFIWGALLQLTFERWRAVRTLRPNSD